MLPEELRIGIIVSSLEDRPKCMHLFAALLLLPPNLQSLQLLVVGNLVDVLRHKPNAAVYALPGLLVAHMENPDTYDFLTANSALGWPHLSISAVYLLISALHFIPGYYLSGVDGGACMNALAAKTKAAADMMHDLSRQPYQFPEDFIFAKENLLSQLEQLKGVPYRRTEFARKSLKRTKMVRQPKGIMDGIVHWMGLS